MEETGRWNRNGQKLLDGDGDIAINIVTGNGITGADAVHFQHRQGIIIDHLQVRNTAGRTGEHPGLDDKALERPGYGSAQVVAFLAEGKAQLERQSPLNSAGKIKAALMVVQGANDPRVNKAESDQIVIALRDRGFPVEYIVAPDEGHGFARPVNNMAMFAAAEKFLAKHLGGRFQESMKPDEAKRLSEITVDVKSVKLAPAVPKK